MSYVFGFYGQVYARLMYTIHTYKLQLTTHYCAFFPHILIKDLRVHQRLPYNSLRVVNSVVVITRLY